jgi:hypothetical protein
MIRIWKGDAHLSHMEVLILKVFLLTFWTMIVIELACRLAKLGPNQIGIDSLVIDQSSTFSDPFNTTKWIQDRLLLS